MRLLLAVASAALLAACGGGAAVSPAASTSSSRPAASSSACPKGAAAAGTAVAQKVKVVSDPTTIGAYSPKSVTIKAGQTVEWDFDDNTGTPHTVTADTGSGMSFDSCLKNQGAKFLVTFPTAGSFAYHCLIHAGMHGDVKVSS